jgi:hypothetical protein
MRPVFEIPKNFGKNSKHLIKTLKLPKVLQHVKSYDKFFKVKKSI